MKRTLLAAILATAAIAFSCSMEEPAQDNSVVMNPTATIANFVFDGPATKTAATFEDNVASFAFEASDVLRAYPLPDGDGLRFTVKTPKGTACVFEGEGFGLEAGTSYAAYYPGDSETVPEVTAIPVDFSTQSQPAASEWNLSDVDFLFATGIQPADGACNFTMSHLGALLIMDVTVKQSGVYKSLVLKSSEKLIPAVGTVDLTADEVVITPAEEGGLTDRITLALGGENGMAIEAGETVTFYMMVPPVDLSNATLTLRLRDAAGNNVLTKDGPGINFEAGKAVEFGTTPLVNLSAVETANTYIVSEPGNYYFNCTKAGNGASIDVYAAINVYSDGVCYAYPANGSSTLEEGHYVRVPLNQNNCIKDVTISNGKIYFTATGNEGNAKIQMRNANDDGVWVWTIWCTDKPAEVTIPTSDGSNNYTLLDRNLGATAVSGANDETVYGLYYMFGDPIGYTAAEWANATTGNQMRSELADTPIQPVYSAGGAVQWYNKALANNYANYIYAWQWGGYGDATGELYHSVGNDNYYAKKGTESLKTMYDPCPVGYKVMAYDVLDGYNHTANFTALSADETGLYLQGSDATAYFPYNGLTCVGGYPYTWGSHGPAVDPAEDGYAYCVYLWTSAHQGSNMAYGYTISNRGVTAAGSGQKEANVIGRGMGIRCMKQ